MPPSGSNEHSVRRTAALALALKVVLVATGPPLARAEPPPVEYGWPVAGPVIRAFEEPPSRFAAGHRGIDIAAPLGTRVRAAAAGVVAFAGAVAGSRFVSIDHADGIRTTYSWLSTVDVRAGQPVEGGETIGSTGHGHPEVDRPHLHFGARRGETYLDPMILLGTAPAAIHLAPLEGSSADEMESGEAAATLAGASEGLPPAASEPADVWLWSRTEPKPRVLPGRASP